MSDLLVVYIFTISIELMLGLVLAITLLLIVAPLGSDNFDEDGDATLEPARPAPRDLPRTPSGALQASFRSLTRGEDDLATLLHTRRLLVEYLEEHERASSAGRR